MKPKLSTYTLVTGAAWAVCIGFFVVGILFPNDLSKSAIGKARLDLQESQEKLAFAQSSKKEETKQRMRERLENTQGSLNTFSCPAAQESALIFEIGQLAHTLKLKKFTSRFPDNKPEQTIEKTDRISEGWLTVEFVADYLTLAAFVNSLERHTPVLFVESIHLRPDDDIAGEAVIRMNLSYLVRKDDIIKTVACAKTSPSGRQ